MTANSNSAVSKVDLSAVLFICLLLLPPRPIVYLHLGVVIIVILVFALAIQIQGRRNWGEGRAIVTFFSHCFKYSKPLMSIDPPVTTHTHTSYITTCFKGIKLVHHSM